MTTWNGYTVLWCIDDARAWLNEHNLPEKLPDQYPVIAQIGHDGTEDVMVIYTSEDELDQMKTAFAMGKRDQGLPI